MLWDHRPGHNRFAGIVLQEYSAEERKLVGRPPTDFQGHAARLHRRPASLQARRLLLPADGGGRHGLGARRHHGAFARTDRALRTASGRAHPDLAPPAGHRTAARRPRRPGRNAKRRRPTWCISAAGRFAIAAAARWAAKPRSSRWSGRRTAGCARRTARAAVLRGCRPGAAGSRVPRAAGARGFRRPEAAVGFPMAALAVAGGALQPDRASRATCGCTAAKHWAACSARPWSRAGSSRTASAPPPWLSSSRSTSSRWPAWSATTTAASFTTSTSRMTTVGEAHPRDVLPSRTRFSRTSSRRRLRCPAACRCICAWRWTTSGFISPTAWTARTGAGCRTVRRQHPVRRSRPSRNSEFHRRLCRHVLPGPGGNPPARRFRLLRVPGARAISPIRSWTPASGARVQGDPRGPGVRPTPATPI